jgi:hypothetical protein
MVWASFVGGTSHPGPVSNGMLARWFLVCCYNLNSLFIIKIKEYKEVVAFFPNYYNIANSKTEA